ncbi:MAG: hypothetical protein K2N28_01345 [Muribaculaceae bacterium]|nr:hypothetical protein [Muribaculaceae bacterium]
MRTHKTILRHYLTAISLVLSTFLGVSTSAQTGNGEGLWNVPRVGGETITEPSPEATAMRRYQDFPVSYATGTADISIPLLDLPGGQVGVSLGLRYHTGGIRRNDISTGVGLGWSLTGLGQVSRQINGFPDEWKGSGSAKVRFDQQYGSEDWHYYQKILHDSIETQYDRYSYYFPGYSGAFMIINGNIRQLPETDLSITRIPDTTDPDATDAFEIMTPEGVKYRFDVKERVSYQQQSEPAELPIFINKSYTAVSAWNLSRITGPQGIDQVDISYTPITQWTRYHNIFLGATTYSYRYVDPVFMWQYEVTDNTNSHGTGGVNQTTFIDQRLPLKITSRSGSIDFTISRGLNTSTGSPRDYITGMTLKDALGVAVSTVTFDNSTTHADNRQRLKAVTKTVDNIVTDKYTFSYFDAVTATGYDAFGYSNGKSGTPSEMHLVDYNNRIRPNRATDSFYMTSAALKSITDITGITTTLDYEPSVINIPGDGSYSPFYGDVTIGMRLSSVTTRCNQTGRYRKRSFSYSDAKCNYPLQLLCYGDFVSQSGSVNEMEFMGAGYNKFLSAAYTSSSKLQGFAMEGATIYYGTVREDIIGTNISTPIRVEYEYNLNSLNNRFVNGGKETIAICLNHYDYPQPTKEYLDLFKNNFPSASKDVIYHPTRGYIEEHIGASPLLTNKTTYEYINGFYRPRYKERSYYSESDYTHIVNGAFCESTVLRFIPLVFDTQLQIDCANDMSFFFTTVATSRFVCDSTVVTTYYDAVGGTQPSREVRTVYLNRRGQLHDTPGFCLNSFAVPDAPAHYPLGTVTSSGGESITHISATAEYSFDISAIECAMKGMRRLPSCEKWVLNTAAGSDSIIRNYEYSRFTSGYIFRPSRVYTVTDPKYDYLTYYSDISQYNAVISSQQYTGYDSRGRITAMTDNQGRRISAAWDDEYDMLMSMSLPDAGLTTSYTIRPLIGYTSITSPSGKTRRFSYSAGRLVAERNTANEQVASYTYQLAGDGTSTDGRNRFTATVHDSTGDATETTYYDGFGLPVQTVATVAGGNLVRSAIEYDALDRPVRQYRPVPASDSDYLDSYNTAAVSHYGDSRPYSSVSYRNMGGDKPLQVIAEGSLMQSHPTQYQYTCNNETTPMYKCRRYRLTGSATSETVRLDGFYKAGALDVTKATDPDGCTLLTFTDWRGIKILERRVLTDNTFADTYYLYDVLGNVRVILPPEASSLMTSNGSSWAGSNPTYSKYVYIYRYDRRGNCVYSKVPGGGAVTMRYDKFNRLTFRSSEELDADGACEFLTYDPIGRPAVSGLYWESLPSLPDTVSATVTYTAVGRAIGDTGYSGCSYINSLLEYSQIGIANYYDSYSNLPTAVFDSLRLRLPDLDPSAAAGNLAAVRTGVYDGTETYLDLTDAAHSLYSLYSYDTEGRVLGVAETSAVPGWETLLTTNYSRLGHKKWETYTVFTPDSVYRTESSITHDAMGNPLDRFDKFRRGTAQEGINGDLVKGIRSEYRYDVLGQLEKKLYGNKDVKYEYNLRGQLTSISAGDLFSQTLNYETGTSPCYNGNISEMSVCYSGGSPITRKYTYDRMNRLTAMTSSDGFNTAYTYNLNSSPLTIQRYGLMSDGTVGLIDDLKLTYSANRLTQVVDYADPVILENSLDFDKSSCNYTYDLDGRLYSDGTITQAMYTPSGNPLYFRGSNNNKLLMGYRYSAAGVKLSSTSYQQIQLSEIDDLEISKLSTGRFPIDSTKLKPTIPTLPIGKITTRYYLGTMEFCDAQNYGTPRFERVTMPWGYIDAAGAVHYYIQDYQGNVRVVADATSNIEQATDYYPYGMPMATSTGAEVNRYKYSGKELETRNGLNFYDFEARLHFPAINFMNQPDVNARDYPWLNPYLYCAANPIANIDPTGRDIVVLNYGTWLNQHLAMLIQNEDGKWQYYSINGNNVFSSGNHTGGREFNDIAVGSWDSPQEFMNSSYNTRLDNDQSKSDPNMNNFGYTEGYQIETTAYQDFIMREKFTEISNTEYDIVSNNCATAVQETMVHALIPVSKPTYTVETVRTESIIGPIDVVKSVQISCNINFIPSEAYKSIIKWNPRGTYIYRENE